VQLGFDNRQHIRHVVEVSQMPEELLGMSEEVACQPYMLGVLIGGGLHGSLIEAVDGGLGERHEDRRVRGDKALRSLLLDGMFEQTQRGPDWNPQQLVFCTTPGTAYARHNWRLQQYLPMLEKAGLPYIRPHDLRHTAATLLLLEGVQPLVVSEMLGHASVAFTLATYGHVLAEMRKPARDAMERLFGDTFA
jgi:integrase